MGGETKTRNPVDVLQILVLLSRSRSEIKVSKCVPMQHAVLGYPQIPKYQPVRWKLVRVWTVGRTRRKGNHRL